VPVAVDEALAQLHVEQVVQLDDAAEPVRSLLPQGV